MVLLRLRGVDEAGEAGVVAHRLRPVRVFLQIPVGVLLLSGLILSVIFGACCLFWFFFRGLGQNDHAVRLLVKNILETLLLLLGQFLLQETGELDVFLLVDCKVDEDQDNQGAERHDGRLALRVGIAGHVVACDFKA